MAKKKNNPNRFVTLELCDERVKRLEGKIDDLKEATQQQHKDIKNYMKTIDRRTYYILASVLFSILLAILAIVAKLI